MIIIIYRNDNYAEEPYFKTAFFRDDEILPAESFLARHRLTPISYRSSPSEMTDAEHLEDFIDDMTDAEDLSSLLDHNHAALVIGGDILSFEARYTIKLPPQGRDSQ